MTAVDEASPYPLDNQHGAASAHHTALADLLDPVSRHRLTGLPVGLAGARVLEVGAGHGSVAWWLAEQVGPTGQVVALDLDPSQIPTHPRIERVRHDLAAGPLPFDDRFDLIHSRLTLQHLPHRRSLLTALAERLRPTGWLLIEDWAGRDRDVVVDAPGAPDRELYERYQATAAAVFDAAGTDRTWAPRLHLHFLAEGLVDVSTVVHEEYWTAGSAGLRLIAAVAQQLRPRLAEHGFTPDEVDRLLTLLRQPGLVVRGHPLYSVAGRRPT